MSIITKSAIRNVSRLYNLKTSQDEDFFDELWELFQIGNKYKRKHKDEINSSLNANYLHLAAAILGDNSFTLSNPAPMAPDVNVNVTDNTFKRIKTFNLQPLQLNLGSKFPKSSKPNRPKPNLQADSGPSNFVIFSDHHLTEDGHRHDYFRKWNKQLYIDLLNWYADNNYGLIENGDVEEYTIFEPTSQIVNGYKSLIKKKSFLGVKEDIGSIDWGDLNAQRINNRVNILTKILSDNQDLYNVIDNKFASKGRRYYTKITGNHDPYFSSRLTDLLPDNIANNLCDGLRINYRDDSGKVIREPKYFITHGHQFDTTTLPQHAFAVGEVISETLGWTMQGADRIWEANKTNQWRNPALSSSFRNILAVSDMQVTELNTISNMVGEAVVEILLQNHEVAWEYFDNSSKPAAVVSEVLTGDEYFKVRHLSETRLVEKMEFYNRNTPLKDFQNPTKVIIGHTHEPRHNSKRSLNSNDIIDIYLNTGSAGRFENFIWGVELVDGEEKIVSWTMDGNTMVRNEWRPNTSGLLTKMDYSL